ncbi:MAG: type II toxin-antitoxin system PemK/MazF family toxin [Acidobacteria bacterium]|nr:type II toxin-antitoxin system PemK/MazF family toxin [Acidobacteriota bacterium]
MDAGRGGSGLAAPANGTVVLVRFPFSDLSASKLRPAVVMAQASRDDVILCQITSQAYTDSSAIEIRTSDFESGTLNRISYARPSKLFTANSSLIEKSVGILSIERFAVVRDAVRALF